jgi:hypothetical protein
MAGGIGMKKMREKNRARQQIQSDLDKPDPLAWKCLRDGVVSTFGLAICYRKFSWRSLNFHESQWAFKSFRSIIYSQIVQKDWLMGVAMNNVFSHLWGSHTKHMQAGTQKYYGTTYHSSDTTYNIYMQTYILLEVYRQREITDDKVFFSLPLNSVIILNEHNTTEKTKRFSVRARDNEKERARERGKANEKMCGALLLRKFYEWEERKRMKKKQTHKMCIESIFFRIEYEKKENKWGKLVNQNGWKVVLLVCFFFSAWMVGGRVVQKFSVENVVFFYSHS